MVLIIQLLYLLPMAVLGAVAVRRQWPHRSILALYAALVALMATVGGLQVPKVFWQGAQFGGEVYAISLGLVWIGVWLWRRPSHPQAFRALAVMVWLLSVTSLVWGPELVGGD